MYDRPKITNEVAPEIIHHGPKKKIKITDNIPIVEAKIKEYFMPNKLDSSNQIYRLKSSFILFFQFLKNDVIFLN